MAGIRGKTEVCLEHLFAKAKEDVCSLLTSFCGVTEQSTRRWRTKRSVPTGEELLKARYFLELHGYVIAEHEGLDRSAIALGWALALGVVTIDEIATVLDFTGNNSRDGTLAYLLGRRSVNENRTRKSFAYAQQLREQTLAAQAQFLKGSVPASAPVIGPVAIVHAPERITVLAPNGKTVTVEGKKGTLLVAAAHNISALIPMAEYLLSDDCTAEDRSKLHELVGDDRVLKLTSRLRRLCSETAREKFTN